MSGPRAKGKRARSRAIIMHAAKGLFEEKGISHVTFNDIAQRADMCRTTIFNHFPTINDLFLAIMEQEVTDILDYCEASKEEGSDLIIRLFEKLIDDAVEYPVFAIKLFANSIINEEERKSVRQIEEIIAKNLKCDEDEKEHRITMLTGIYYGLINHGIIAEIPFDADSMKRKFNQYAKPYLD